MIAIVVVLDRIHHDEEEARDRKRGSQPAAAARQGRKNARSSSA